MTPSRPGERQPTGLNVTTDVTVGRLTELRAACSAPLDMYLESPDEQGGIPADLGRERIRRASRALRLLEELNPELAKETTSGRAADLAVPEP